jgi:two-component system sensor histidine kinase CpxA
MRSLFVKIFLWFWLASILIIASTLILMSVLEPFEPIREDGRYIRRLAHFGRTAVDLLEQDGPDALRDFVSQRGRRHGPGRNLFIFDKKMVSFTGRPAPSHVTDLAERAAKSGVTEFLQHEKSILIAQTLYGSGGNYYLMVSELPQRPRPSPVSRFFNPRFISLRLLAIFIVASVFCYWLAWYLASPASKLKAATRQLASGDLKTRVGQLLGGRKDELADLGHDFDHMAGRIESLMSSQNRLLRDISHELRSPLTRLNVALELARKSSSKEIAGPLDRIEHESGRINELIGQLLTLTSLESGAERFKKKSVDLTQLVRAIAEDANFEAASRNISVKTTLEEGLLVHGSEELLRQAVENVIRNALRYTTENTEVDIILKHQQINSADYAILSVHDRGPGVPESALSSLFQPFYRVADARDRQSGGTGIGLAITDRAIRLHGGKVQVVNATDGGLIIRIDLPVQH